MPRSKTVKTKFFFSFLMTVMLTLIIISIPCFMLLSANIKESTDSYYVNILKQVQKNMLNQLDEVAMMALNYSGSAWMNELMMIQDSSMKGRVTTWDLYSYNQDLMMYNALSDAIDEVGIIFNGKNIAISSVRLSSLDSFLNHTFKLDGLVNTRPEDLGNKFYSQELFYDVTLTSENITSRKGILIVNSMPVDAYMGRIRATMLVFIDYNNIRNRINSICLNEDVGVFLVNKDNQILVDYNMKDPDIMNYIQVAEESSENGDIIKTSTISNSVYSIGIPKYGWKIIAVVPNSMFWENAKRVFALLFVALMVVIAIGIILSRYLAGNRYRPLKLLLDSLYKTTDESTVYDGRNEYEYINEKIKTLIRQEKELKVEIEQQKPVIYGKYIENLITKPESLNEDMVRRMELAGINLPFGKYCVAVVFMKQIEDADEFTGGLKALISNSKIHFYWCIIQRSLAIVFNFEKEEAMADFWEAVEQDPAVTARFGIGNTVGHPAYICKSYTEAIAANDYRTIDSTRKTLIYNHAYDQNACYYYPLDLEMKFANCILKGDYIQAVSILDNLIASNRSNDSASAMALNNLFTNLELTVLKVINSAQLTISVRKDNYLTDSSYSIQEKRERILSLCRSICNEIAERNVQGNSHLWTEIIKYIDENYMDNNLSLEAAAEIFQFNSSSFSVKFKEYKGISFTQNLNRKRIDEACLLIRKGMSFNEAALKVGYSSEDTFRRAFKKYRGISPRAYFAQDSCFTEKNS